MNVERSHGEDPGGAEPRPFMRRSVPTEYLAMAIMMHAVLGVAAWAVIVWLAPGGLVLISAGLWIIGRSVGAFCGRWFTPLVTLGFGFAVGVLCQANLSLPYAGLVVFSPWVFLLMLSLILVADLVELALSRRSFQ